MSFKLSTVKVVNWISVFFSEKSYGVLQRGRTSQYDDHICVNVARTEDSHDFLQDIATERMHPSSQFHYLSPDLAAHLHPCLTATLE